MMVDGRQLLFHRTPASVRTQSHYIDPEGAAHLLVLKALVIDVVWWCCCQHLMHVAARLLLLARLQ